jgi:hypothetical protein
MINARRLLDDLKRMLKRLEDDLRQRAGSVEAMQTALQREYAAAKEAGRAGEAFEVWREGMLTQAGAAWLLSGVFVRFLEDNGLVDEALLSGPGERREQASEHQMRYFQRHPTDSDRDYLYDICRTVQTLPAVAGLFDESHNPIWVYGISGDAAKELIDFWRRRVPETGELVHDFTDESWNTRFLGDLYQDLSAEARKRYALLQTPEFVEEFILDRTLEPAIAEFGLKEVRLIDPTCGSGHFLLGAFQRILDRWVRAEPATPERALVQRTLDAVYGVDVNPFAVAIARFRLLVAALQASGIKRLKDAPGFRLNVAVGDSLLHGRRFDQLDLGDQPRLNRRREGIGHAYRVEDLTELNCILGQQYHAVVGNPPYITVKDRALNQAYRNRFSTCHRQYSLVVPFVERFFELAIYGHDAQPAGHIGMITANSFMKREFGKKLIEEFFPRIDLTHVIDTSGAYIPGHGTPTVILFGRDRPPVGQTVRAALGIRGEPSTPLDPAQGQVWRSIVDLLDHSGAQNDFVSVTDVPRKTFAKHPWSIGGGGAADLKQLIEASCSASLVQLVESLGRTTVVGEDDCWILDPSTTRRLKVNDHCLEFGVGECIRDWGALELPLVIYPYKEIGGRPINPESRLVTHYLWPFRTLLSQRTVFGRSLIEQGRPWFEHLEHYVSKLRTPLSIAFAFVATHNHFVLDRGGKVFNRSAPIIKLPADATEDDHLALLGFLNSSTACFWMKQIFHNKGSTVDERGARQTTIAFENFYEFTGTGLQKFPVTEQKPLDLAAALDRMAQGRQAHLPAQLAANFPLSRAALDEHKRQAEALLGKMIAMQEELDWRCYTLYGLTDQDLCYRDSAGNQCEPPELALGQRAFEIVMARQMATDELETTWFERHGSKPITELPDHWPEDYKRLVERRMALIERDPYINLIERPEYKRRWNTEPWEEQERRALRNWLLDRLEESRYWQEPSLQTTRTLANKAQMDSDFLHVAELYRGHAGFDVHTLVGELVEAECVPFLPVLRYKPSGLHKREIWECTWELQRREDAIDAEVAATLTRRADENDEQYQERMATEQRRRKREEVGDIPPPPKYTSADFRISTYWRLCGALDVPKERFISYPFCSRDADPALLICWAGWDHLQQAKALAAWYSEVTEQEGWPVERLKPLLAGLAEIIPWLKQWHNDLDPEFQERMGDFFETFLQGQLQLYGLTRDDLKHWTPTASGRPRRGRQRL